MSHNKPHEIISPKAKLPQSGISRGKLPKLIVILGPTASGKTELGIKCASSSFDGEIISADSRTIYKKMNIGTAKPMGKYRTVGNHRASIIRGVPHYMIDIIDITPHQSPEGEQVPMGSRILDRVGTPYGAGKHGTGQAQEFTVAQFKRRAIQIIFDILKRNKVPFIVGGTMLYISALVDNFDIPKVPPDKKLRRKLENMIKQHGLAYAYNQLLTYDPHAEDFIQAQNPRRVIRALEVCIKTEKPFSSQRIKGDPLFNTLQIGIDIEREKLEHRIDTRVDKMIQNGLMQEAIKLYHQYPDNRILKNTICYQEFFPYVDILSSHKQEKLPGYIKDSILQNIKKNTRGYARRQMSWWKKDKRIVWVTGYKQAKKKIKEFLAT